MSYVETGKKTMDRYAENLLLIHGITRLRKKLDDMKALDIKSGRTKLNNGETEESRCVVILLRYCCYCHLALFTQGINADCWY